MNFSEWSDRFERALWNVINQRPNRTLAERNLFRLLECSLDEPLHLVDGEETFAAVMPHSMAADVEAILKDYLSAELIKQIEYGSYAGAATILARLFDPERSANIDAAISDEIAEMMAEAD